MAQTHSTRAYQSTREETTEKRRYPVTTVLNFYDFLVTQCLAAHFFLCNSRVRDQNVDTMPSGRVTMLRRNRRASAGTHGDQAEPARQCSTALHFRGLPSAPSWTISKPTMLPKQEA